ncbi:MAG: TIGR02996 domain-containing protein [Gemmataceae bacterium]
MSTSTLDALHRAVIAQPEDRTVRLVYADALDETGDKADAVRASFIRDQIQQEELSETEPLHIGLGVKCRNAFEANWPHWWHSVCDAGGLPLPHLPSKRLRDRLSRAVGRESSRAGWPYMAAETTLHHGNGGFCVQFLGGFPEWIRLYTRPDEQPPLELGQRWGDAMPIVQLMFDRIVTPDEWQRIEGPHLTRLPHLTVSPLLADLAIMLAASPHLANLTRLTLEPRSESPQMFPEIIRYVVRSPTWKGLRTLRFLGHMNPEAIRVLASVCTLEHLEELELHLGNPGFFGALSQVATALLQRFIPAFSLGTPPDHWAEFGPALESLAAAPWVKRLRRLRITADTPQGLLGMMRLYGSAEHSADLIPDTAVLSLADAVNTATLEKLVLPGAVISPSMREELLTRLAGRVAFR